MNNTILLGLPGAYQNWVLGALDPDSKVRLSDPKNFITEQSSILFYKKLDTELTTLDNQATVINSFVKQENFVWYLYNFFEKTDNVGIEVERLVSQLFNKASGTVAFDGLLKHFITSYKLTSQTDPDYLNNAAIEFFYLLLIDQNSKFKYKSQYTNEAWINIEYNNFGDVDCLKNKFCGLPGYNQLHFQEMYILLSTRNQKYLTNQKNFVSKLLSGGNEFDILQTAYIGALLYWHDGNRRDWFNTQVRNSVREEYQNLICNQAKKML